MVFFASRPYRICKARSQLVAGSYRCCVVQTDLDGVHPGVVSSRLARHVGLVHANFDSRADRRDRQERPACPEGGADTLAKDISGELVERSDVDPPSAPSLLAQATVIAVFTAAGAVSPPSAPSGHATAVVVLTTRAAVVSASAVSPIPLRPLIWPSSGSARGADLFFGSYPSSFPLLTAAVAATTAVAAIESHAIALHVVSLHVVSLHATTLHADDGVAPTIGAPATEAAITHAAPAGLSTGFAVCTGSPGSTVSIAFVGFTDSTGSASSGVFAGSAGCVILTAALRGVVAAGRPAAYSRYLSRPALGCGEGG